VTELQATVKDLEDQLSKAMGAIEQDNEQLETDKAALDEKIASLEAELSSAADSDEIEQLRTELRDTQEILREAKETMARDEDVVHQWEGMFILCVFYTYCSCTSGI
jgi:predicted  nucleic acid-binding Zn-ribbon protein